MKKPLMTLGLEEKPEMKSPIDSLIIDLRVIVNEFQDNPSKYIKAFFKSRK